MRGCPARAGPLSFCIIYLDHNSTTQPSPAAAAAAQEAATSLWHNPSSVHRAGQAVRRRVELARESVAKLLCAKPRDVIFTSGGTESIDLALRGALDAITPTGAMPTLITTAIEHAAVRELAEAMEKAGRWRVERLSLGAGGLVDLDRARELIAAVQSPALLSVQWANNETGVIQPLATLAALARGRGVLVHTDATQWVGKMPMPEGEPPFDLLTCAAHKWHGVKGAGILLARRGVRVRPVLHGTQELGRRGGTENVPAILAAGVAADEAVEWLADASRGEACCGLRDAFEHEVLQRVPDVVVNRPSRDEDRLWNTSNIGFPRLEAEALLLLLSERGVYASAGAACSSGSLEPSPVLLAMGIAPEIAHGSLRFSLCRHTTREELRDAAAILAECVARLRESMPG